MHKGLKVGADQMPILVAQDIVAGDPLSVIHLSTIGAAPLIRVPIGHRLTEKRANDCVPD